MELPAKLDLLGEAAAYDVSAPGRDSAQSLLEDAPQLNRFAGCISEAQVPGGRCLPVLKVLLSNECRNDCYYCGTRCSANVRRETLQPEELVKGFLALERRGMVQGLFLSSGVRDDAERTQEQMQQVVETLRHEHDYRGFIHLKVLPGVSDAAVEAAVRVASRVSVNLEAASVRGLGAIAPDKHLREELLGPLTRAADRARQSLRPVAVTTQFVVGGGPDSDMDFLRASNWLYDRLGLRRAYYSAFRPVPDTPLSNKAPCAERERRLYQADWLLREYGFDLEELVPDADGYLVGDPKLAAAQAAPWRFPVDVNHAGREELLHVPGIGPRAADRIIAARRRRSLTTLRALKLMGARRDTAAPFVVFSGRRASDDPGNQLCLALPGAA